eukprot:752884-Hanusia_phi.AAC.3
MIWKSDLEGLLEWDEDGPDATEDDLRIKTAEEVAGEADGVDEVELRLLDRQLQVFQLLRESGDKIRSLEVHVDQPVQLRSDHGELCAHRLKPRNDGLVCPDICDNSVKQIGGEEIPEVLEDFRILEEDPDRCQEIRCVELRDKSAHTQQTRLVLQTFASISVMVGLSACSSSTLENATSRG